MFKLAENGTNVGTELLAGLTTYMTMVYIAFVNPAMLAETGMDRGAVFVATCLAAAFGSALMGLYANFPVALAPGMGLNAYFTYSVVKGMGVPWETALAAVFASGVLFLIVSVTPIRQWIIDSISKSQKLAISVGIGFFLAVIGLQGAGLIAGDPATLVKLGDLKSPAVAIAVAAFILMAALDARRIHGAILIGILAAYAAGLVLGLATFSGVASLPPSIAPVFLKMDLGALLNVAMVPVVLTLFFVVLFDNTGTLIGVARAAGMMQPDGSLPRIGQALAVDSTATMAGAALGTSTTTSYIESAAGVNAGGRTGLVAVTVAALFLATLFFAPLAGSIPAFATAPALIFVGCLMMAGARDIDFDDATEYIPAAVTIIAMPLTFSIADGIAFGFVAYAGTKLLAGRWAELPIAVSVLAGLFILRFALL
ncbi:MAG: NCS2 family permease [Hyphomicrobium sp.]|uniref:NCS2 family permease n=1 Tax=Hyphomicrobium sp. TaxID=82 RepID=UPI0013247675|nr:NCS2 family permease [Hyphomicrobium sp.]KAB2942630.1 MAG: NCS2 family permease [Hyphomicrobium sp.]MBZ0208614.1 NCS2 family permease [Hyphomicrobium sp.]